MSSSDVRMLEELTARVVKLEACAHPPVAVVSREEYEALLARVRELYEAVHGKDVSGELYGAEANHTADREARAALVRRPPRPA